MVIGIVGKNDLPLPGEIRNIALQMPEPFAIAVVMVLPFPWVMLTPSFHFYLTRNQARPAGA